MVPRWSVAYIGRNGERVHHCIAEYFSKGVEHQVVLHEAEPSCNSLRRQPYSESQKSWSKKPSNADMEQVRELLDLIKGMEINSRLVAESFIVCRV